MKLAPRPPAATPRPKIKKTAYLLGCVVTIGLWAMVLVLAAAIT